MYVRRSASRMDLAPSNRQKAESSMQTYFTTSACVPCETRSPDMHVWEACFTGELRIFKDETLISSAGAVSPALHGTTFCLERLKTHRSLNAPYSVCFLVERHFLPCMRCFLSFCSFQPPHLTAEHDNICPTSFLRRSPTPILPSLHTFDSTLANHCDNSTSYQLRQELGRWHPRSREARHRPDYGLGNGHESRCGWWQRGGWWQRRCRYRRRHSPHGEYAAAVRLMPILELMRDAAVLCNLSVDGLVELV